MTPKITNDPNRFDSGDPELQCFRPGVPRANYMPFPFQIFQNQNQILVVYEYKWSMRQIHVDPQMEAPVDSWMGWSNGNWEGDTLVVDVKGFNGYSWFDRAGNYRDRHAPRRRALDAAGAESSDVRGNDRGPERLHAAVEDQLPDLPPPRAECSTDRVQLRPVRRTDCCTTRWDSTSHLGRGPTRSARRSRTCGFAIVREISFVLALVAVAAVSMAVLMAQAPSRHERRSPRR